MKITTISSSVIIMIMPVISIAASFDCSKAKGYTELTICTTPTLSTLDDNLSILYKKINQENPDNVQLIKKSQLSWLKDVRNKATTAQSLKDAYIARINDLNMILGENKSDKVERPTNTISPPVVPIPAPEATHKANNEIIAGRYNCDNFSDTLNTPKGLIYRSSLYDDIKYANTIDSMYNTYTVSGKELISELSINNTIVTIASLPLKMIAQDGSSIYQDQNSSYKFYLSKLDNKTITVYVKYFQNDGNIAQARQTCSK